MKHPIYSRASDSTASLSETEKQHGMDAATEISVSSSLTGGLQQWLSRTWQKLTGEDVGVGARSLLQDAEFTHALVALAAKLVAVDGKPTTVEYTVFCNVFPLADGDEAKLRSMFLRAMHDRASVLQYARQIRAMYPEATALYREILDRLLKVATADAALNAAEHELLMAVAQIFDVPMAEWKAMMAGYSSSTQSNPYAVIGANKRMSDSEIRHRYMAQVRLLHPDRYQAVGASDETVNMLSDKLAIVNAAYEIIMRERDQKRAEKK